jgi:hypothetical protein
MSSIREQIAENIVEVLKDSRDPKPVLVTRETLDVENLARTQYPAMFITTQGETRDPLSLNGSVGSRFASVLFDITCYVNGQNLDTQRNDIIERVEEALALDVTRGGVALDTQVIEILVNNEQEPPVGEVLVTVKVEYTYRRGLL